MNPAVKLFPSKLSILGLVIIACFLLSGCGLGIKTPEMSEFIEGPDATKVKINTIEAHVKCELKRAVQNIVYIDMDFAERNSLGRRLQWFDSWAAKSTLAISAEEQGSLNPGVSFITPMIPANTYFPQEIMVTTPQSYNLGVGGGLSSTANRQISKDFYYAFSQFLRQDEFQAYSRLRAGGRAPQCNHLDGILIEGDLKLKEWLEDELLSFMTGVSTRPGSTDFVDPPTTSISTKIFFTIKTEVNVTPTWQLVRIAANSDGRSFAGTYRTRFYELDITLGPTVLKEVLEAKSPNGKMVRRQISAPSRDLDDAFLASKIGSAVAAAVRVNNR